MGFLKKITRKVQFRILLVVIIIGTVAFIMGSGPSDDSATGIERFFNPGPWRVLGIICVVFLFQLPLLGLIREKILSNHIYNNKIGNRELKLEEICEIFNLDFEVIKRKYGNQISKKEIIRMIKEYFIK